MNYKDTLNNRFLTFVLLILIPSLNAQQFKRIETQANLGHISNNNGIAIADFDLDNDLDIFIVGTNTYNSSKPNTWSRLLRNNNDGSFEDITQQAGLAQGFNHDMTFTMSFIGSLINSNTIFGEKMGVSWGDYNNDGYPDIFLSNAVQSQLYRNNGDGTFSNVTTQAGLEASCAECYLAGALWWDYNNDGFLDLYLSDYNYHTDNKLYKNKGDGTFELISDTNLGGKANSFSAISIDANNDGWLDLYIANDYNQNNFLYINERNGSFTESALTYGIEDPRNGMGLAVCDYDNNGLFDLFVGNINNNGLYVDNGGNYTNIAEISGIKETGWAWGAVFSDFDLDGYEDFFVANGFGDLQFNKYLKNVEQSGSRVFTEVNSELENNETSFSRSAVSFDYDNDGDLDLITSNFDGTVYFYENTTINLNNENQQTNAWVQIKLTGTTSNPDALGSKIEIIDDTNLKQHRFYQGSAYQSQSLQPVHFGLQNAVNITSIKVTWPSGLQETITDIPVNKIVEVTENNGYVVSDLNTAVKISGCTNADACNYDSNATADNSSCSFLASGDISGNTNSSPLSTETYTYNNGSGNLYEWSIEHGEIIEGQGTSSVSVRWDVTDSGTVNCINSNATCKTERTSLQITLDEANSNNTSNNFSVARLWNEVLLEAIRNDFARPTVHARNLFHTSIAMYDAWAIYHPEATPYLLGNTVHGFQSQLNDFSSTEETSASMDKTISYAAYRLLMHRFRNSPGVLETIPKFNELMALLNYDIDVTSTDYSQGDPAALGNYIAETIINYGLQDGSNEADGYNNTHYTPINAPLDPNIYGSTQVTAPNRWQPLTLDVFIDQSGNVLRENTPEFLGPEWGNVAPFSLSTNDLTTYNRDSNNYNVFFDPGTPPYLDDASTSEYYKWGFSLVSVWGAHLSPHDGVLWDISPKGIGHIPLSALPDDFANFPNFYNTLEGGDIGTGRSVNPITGQPYETQLVPRGDYTRVLAEFWADGPDSETPPGHWFVLLNYIGDSPFLEKKITGTGDVVDNLEWDVKSYFMLGGAMHDSAITAWGIKGWYDYIRPISAIRYMAEKGQSTNPSLPNYHEEGIPLIDNYIELVHDTDPLAGTNGEHVNKIKVRSWKGHDFIDDPKVDEAGIGWILAESWWPYQRPSFITPPFAGYVSGHSTYSRAAAEVLTRLTGSEFFPGGVGEFIAKKNEFLVFEEGPSQDVILQWATYRDASDQCSLSRIWGGIHPPADDIPGRRIGEKIGNNVVDFALPYFSAASAPLPTNDMILYPNPLENQGELTILNTEPDSIFYLFDLLGRRVPTSQYFTENRGTTTISIQDVSDGIYILKGTDASWKIIIN